MSRAFQIAVAVDQLVNAACGGYADETMSARCWRLRAVRPYAWLRPTIDRVFFWQVDHCRSAYESERARSQLPADYRDTNTTRPADAGFFTPAPKEPE
ncbi:hypothetical protein [Massilia forsythiae]|uniref:hypothetical protein n=1 Tax=Massilia forsythiae TaxID=2728020 RepID=UPI001B7D1E6E|nr:hypothetical protein [Massilia forsythiae]